MGAFEREKWLKRIDAIEGKTALDIAPAASSARAGLSSELGATMFPEAQSVVPSGWTDALAQAEHRQDIASRQREAELETPHPVPAGATPVTVREPSPSLTRIPAFQLPGPSVELPGAPPRRTYGRSWEEARELGKAAETRSPFAEKLTAERETKAAWAKAAQQRRMVNLAEIREEMAGIRPSPMKTGPTGEKEPEDWKPSLPEKVRRGVVSVGEAPLSMLAAIGKAAPGVLLQDPVTIRAIGLAGMDTGENLWKFSKAVAEDPVGVLGKILDEDPVLFGQLVAVPLTGGGSALTALGKLAMKSPRLATAASVALRVGKLAEKAGGEAAAVPLRLGLTATGLPLPGSYPHLGAKLIAGSEFMPPALRSAARRVILKPTEALETLSPELRALSRAQVMPGVEERLAAETALSRLYGMAEETAHPITGEMVPTRQLFTEILHAQPKHWRNELLSEGRATRWSDPKTGMTYGGNTSLPEDANAFERLRLVDAPKGMDAGEFMRKKLLAREFAGDKDLPPTLEEYGISLRWRDASGRLLRPEDLPADPKALKGLKPEYVPVEESVIRPPETPFRLSFAEKQAQTEIPLRPAAERVQPPGLGEPVADIVQREIPFPPPERGPTPRPGQAIAGLPASLREGLGVTGYRSLDRGELLNRIEATEALRGKPPRERSIISNQIVAMMEHFDVPFPQRPKVPQSLEPIAEAVMRELGLGPTAQIKGAMGPVILEAPTAWPPRGIEPPPSPNIGLPGRAFAVKGEPETPFVQLGKAVTPPEIRPIGVPPREPIQGALPLEPPPPKGGLPTPVGPVLLASEGKPAFTVSEGPKGRMVAQRVVEPRSMQTPKPPKMSDDNWRLVREVVQPVRDVIDNLGARAAELGIVEGEDVIRHFGSYLSRRYDWNALLKKNPALAAKMNVIKEQMGLDSPIEAAAARYSEYLQYANEGQDMAARRVIGDLPMQTLRDAYELMADGPNVVRDTTFRLANAVSRGEFLEGVANLPGATSSERVLPSGWKRVPTEKLPSGRPVWGPLAGKAVSGEVWDALKLIEDLNEGQSQSLKWLARAAAENEPGAKAIYAILKTETAGVKAWKQFHVLWPYNLSALPRNFINAAMNQALMGGIAPWHPANASVYVRMGRQLLGKGGPELDEWRAASAASGGRSLLDDARMRSAVHEVASGMSWPKVKAALRNGVKQDVEWLRVAKKYGLDKPGELYAASDEFFKAVAYTIVRNMQKGYAGGNRDAAALALRRARRIWGDAAETMLQGGPRAALRHAYESFLDYSDVPGWVSTVSRFGLAPFYKFTALTAEQITNYFRHRPMHSLAMRALGDYSERFLSYASGFSPEEIAEAKRLSPAYRGSQVFVRRDAAGRPLFIQSQYIVSAGSLFTPQREYGEGGATQALSEMLYGGPVVQSFFLPTQLGGAPAPDWFTGRPLSPPSAPSEIKQRRLLGKAWEIVAPPLGAFTWPAITAAVRGESAPHQAAIQPVATVLAGALTGTKLAATEVPRRKASLFGEQQRRIRELDAEIRRLTFSGAMADIEQIPALRRQKRLIQLEFLERLGTSR